MIWTAVLLASLGVAAITVPASVNIHESNIALAQAEQEKAEFAVMQEQDEYTNDWCDPKADQ